MVGDRLRVESHGFRDLLDGMTLREQTEHLEFACGQTVSGVGAEIVQRQFLSNFSAEEFISSRFFLRLALYSNRHCRRGHAACKR